MLDTCLTRDIVCRMSGRRTAKTSENKGRTLTFRLSEKLLDDLEKFRTVKGGEVGFALSISDVVRHLIIEGLARSQQTTSS